jgi:DNA polymerase-1
MLIQCDASQLEWRVLAWLSGDSIALREINDGLDFHAKNQETLGLPTRLIAKIFLFRTIYRGSGWSFANDPDFIPVSDDPKFWDSMNEKFYRKYKGIDLCHKIWAQQVAAHKPIVSPLGREWLIPVNEDGSLPWTVLTNYPVQGTGNDLMAVARISLRRRLAGKQALLVSTVHDSIVVDCPDDEVEFVKNTMYEVFDDIPKNVAKLWSVNLPCAFPCEVKVGLNLKDMTKVSK